MSKYIDAEKLISEILKLRSESCISESDDYYEYAKSEIIDIIESLRQERPESSNGKFVFPNFLYARTVKVQKPAEKQDYSGLNDSERAIHRGFLAAGVENVPVGIIKETTKECITQMKPAEWSLQDARPGDVLTTGAVTFIFKSANGDFANTYCYFSEMTGKFNISETAEIYLKYVQPASVEQRVRLYEHLLRYIRIHTQEEHWKPSEEDEKILYAIELHINQLDSNETINGFSSSDMLRVLKYLRPQPKQEWSEEDEKMVRFYEDDYDNNLGNMPMCDVIENRIKFKDWLLKRLKPLRPSWKPSKEQMEALKSCFYESGECCPDEDGLRSLYEDLKKLM